MDDIVLTDSHCHFDLLDDSPQNVIARAANHHVSKFLTICTDINKAESIIEFTERDDVYASVGQHPSTAYAGGAELVERIVSLARSNPKVVAIGETGLDYYRDGNSPAQAQHESFEAHMEAAGIVGLPLVIHSRSADEDTLAALAKYKGVRFIMHCFGGDVAFAKKCLDLGGYISFSGILTFKNAVNTHDVCRYVPLERVLIETDAPYLAPVPHRGEKNEPAYVRFVAEEVARTRNVTLEEVARITTGNFEELIIRKNR